MTRPTVGRKGKPSRSLVFAWLRSSFNRVRNIRDVAYVATYCTTCVFIQIFIVQIKIRESWVPIYLHTKSSDWYGLKSADDGLRTHMLQEASWQFDIGKQEPCLGEMHARENFDQCNARKDRIIGNSELQSWQARPVHIQERKESLPSHTNSNPLSSLQAH